MAPVTINQWCTTLGHIQNNKSCLSAVWLWCDQLHKVKNVFGYLLYEAVTLIFIVHLCFSLNMYFLVSLSKLHQDVKLRVINYMKSLQDEWSRHQWSIIRTNHINSKLVQAKLNCSINYHFLMKMILDHMTKHHTEPVCEGSLLFGKKLLSVFFLLLFYFSSSCFVLFSFIHPSNFLTFTEKC